MGVLQKGKANYPFWGASINLITGLDPLSLQTTSEATYATLLPGISNLTNRLRYYGFYCWLLDFYFKKEKQGNSSEQYKFIRRAELMIAIIMQSERKEILQITGSTFASDLIFNLSGKSYDLALGADKEKDDPNKAVYWKYASGAFGQYYYGAMRALSLVVATTNEDGDVIYNVTQKHPRQKVCGKDLSDAFDETLSSNARELFYNNIKRGKLNVDDIPELIKYFSIDKINSKSSEWQIYVNMLLDKDEPSLETEELFSFHRKETVLELINTAIANKNEYNWYNSLLKAYSFKLGTKTNPVSETQIGWYVYQFNEYYQYACGTIFWGTLQFLYSFQQDQYLPTFVKKLSAEIAKELCKDLKNVSPDHKLNDALTNFPKSKDEETLHDSIKSSPTSDPIEAAKNGFLLLFKLYIENKDLLPQLKDHMSRNQMIREGNMADGLISFQSSENEILQTFIEQFILRKIIYRHQMVAIRKMGNGSQSTHKFIIEEQYIRFIDTFPPRNTSPRMNALWNLLYDLDLIDDEGKITDLHKKILNN